MKEVFKQKGIVMTNEISTAQKGIHWGIFSDTRQYVMGLAIFWVVLYHGNDVGVRLQGEGGIVDYIFSRGFLGVEIFLLVSGIGIYFSLSNDSRIWQFYLKRIRRVMIPCLLISLPYWIWQDVYRMGDWGNFFEDWLLISFWTEGCHRLWFVAMIMALYIIAPLLYKLLCVSEGKRRVRFILLLVGVLAALWLLMRYCPELYDKLEIGLTRIPIFVYGMYVAPRVKERKPFTNGELCIFLGAGLLYSCVSPCGLEELAKRSFGGLAGVSLTLLFALFAGALQDMHWRGILTALKYMGTYSLEIYIVHGLLRRYFRDRPVQINYRIGGHAEDNYLTSYLVIMVLTFLLVALLAVIKGLCRKKADGQSNAR